MTSCMADQKVSRALFLHVIVSVDGYICDAAGALDFRFIDDEFERYLDDLLESIGGMILGRVAFDQLASFWPNADSSVSAAQRRRMHELPKFVLTRGRLGAAWHNAQALEGDPALSIARLKQQAGPPLALFAGANAVQTVLRLGLFDELRLVINPILLGGGTRLFESGQSPRELRLMGTRQFGSGAVLLSYEAGRR